MRGGLTPCMNGYSRPRELRSSPCVTTHPITGPSTKPQSPPLTGALSWRASVPCEARAGMLVHATSIALVPASAAEPKRQLRAALIESRGDPTTRPAKEAIAALVALRPPAPSVCIQRRPISAVPLTGIGRRARPWPRCRCREQPGSSLGACSGASTLLSPPQLSPLLSGLASAGAQQRVVAAFATRPPRLPRSRQARPLRLPPRQPRLRALPAALAADGHHGCAHLRRRPSEQLLAARP